MEVCTVTLLIDIPVAMAITSFFCLSPSCVISQNGNVFFLAAFKHYSQWDGAYMMSFFTYRLRRSFRT
jgi:hypothetical protein